MDKTLQVDLTWLNFMVGALIPLLTGLVVKWKASSQLKSIVNLVLSAVAGALTTVIANQGAMKPKEFVAGIAATLVTSWASYGQLWKPSGIADKVAQVSPDFGIGPSSFEEIVESAFTDQEKQVIREMIEDEIAKRKPARKAAAKKAAPQA